MPETEKHSSVLSRGQIVVVLSLAAAIIGLISDSLQLVPKVGPYMDRLINGTEPVNPPKSTLNAPPDETKASGSAPNARVEPPVNAQPLPPEAAPAAKTTQALSRHDILIDFPSYATASPQTGVEIARIDRQSRLKGLLCAGDAVVKIDGAQLEGKDGVELHDDLVRKLGASADFVIHFKPFRRSKEIEWDESGQFGVLRGREIREGRASRRDC